MSPPPVTHAPPVHSRARRGPPGCPQQDPECPGLHGDGEGLTPLERALIVRIEASLGTLADEFSLLRQSVPDRRTLIAAVVALWLLTAFSIAAMVNGQQGPRAAGAAAEAAGQLLHGVDK